MKKIIIAIIALLLVVLVVFKNSNNTISIISDYDVPTSFEDAYQKASYIVIGNFGEYLNDWNMARDEDDVTKESSNDVYIGKIYSFKITQVLKGNIDSDIKINIPYSERIYIDDDKQEYLDYQLAQYFEPDNNKEYILYLDYDKDFDDYYASFVPLGLVIDNDNISYIIESQESIEAEYTTNKNHKYTISQEGYTYYDFIGNMTYNEFISKIKNI